MRCAIELRLSCLCNASFWCGMHSRCVYSGLTIGPTFESKCGVAMHVDSEGVDKAILQMSIKPMEQSPVMACQVLLVVFHVIVSGFLATSRAEQCNICVAESAAGGAGYWFGAGVRGSYTASFVASLVVTARLGHTVIGNGRRYLKH